MTRQIEIIYEDPQLLVVRKPAGVAAQSDRGSAPDMVNLLKNQIWVRDHAVPEIYVVHRLDKPVAGLMVYAKTKRAAAELSAQIRDGETFSKRYAALAEGEFPETTGVRVPAADWLLEDARANVSRVVPAGTAGAKEAKLYYTGVWAKDGKTLFDVELITGRRHQIRVQFASRGMGLAGDRKYNPGTRERELGLFCRELSFRHPETGEQMHFAIEAPWK